MYFYQTHPVRCYPDFKKQLKSQMNAVTFYNPIKFSKKELAEKIYRWTDRSQIPELNKKGIIKLIVGPYESHHLKKDDFTFTLWQHPVDHIYEMYRYARYTKENNPEVKIDEYFNIDDFTIETFVDHFLNNNGKIILKDGHEVIPEILRISSMPKHNFVGAIEYIDDFIEKVEDNLKVKIQRTERMKFKEVKENYRKKDLEKLLKKDIELFERNLP